MPSSAAIIDIGSNSMRLVVYDALKRAPVPIYNEKVMCQLGKGLAATGRLNPDGVEMAKGALTRYLALSRQMGVGSLHVMATAAVRDATDGASFARALEREHGIAISVISGEHEARLGALGILASIHAPAGITGDLGGGSMELVHLENGVAHAQTTLPIGPLRLLDENRGNRGDMRKSVVKTLETAPWLNGARARDFYAIGGTFRAIARVHMELSGYPLRILHQYTAPAGEIAAFAGQLAEMSDEKLARLPGLPAKRVPAVPPAAMILRQLIERAGVERVVFSTAGIREGYLFEMLPEAVRREDALIAGCYEIAQRHGHEDAYAHELLLWMKPLFADETDAEHRLRLAFCLLSEIGHRIHPEYRAEWACERVLYSSFTGLSHAERAQLALALYHRYQYKLRFAPPVFALLDARARAWARLAGSCANLAYHLTGGISGALPLLALKTEKKNVGLLLPGGAAALQGDAVRKRLSGVEESWQELRASDA